jgi:predicted nicotinamide N-methyase
MKTLKRLQFWQEAPTVAVHAQLLDTVVVLEDLESVECPIATWPAALVLAAYIAQHRHLFRGKRICELGAGTALPSVLCARPSVGAAAVFASERPEETDLLRLIQRTIHLNNCTQRCVALPLDWRCDTLPIELRTESIDVILGADVFYCDDDFSRLFRLVHRLFLYHPQAVFITSYQVRQAKRVIWPWLQKYELVAEEVPSREVLSASHRLGICYVQRPSSAMDEVAPDHEEPSGGIEEIAVPTFEDIHLYVIRRRTTATASSDG